MSLFGEIKAVPGGAGYHVHLPAQTPTAVAYLAALGGRWDGATWTVPRAEPELLAVATLFGWDVPEELRAHAAERERRRAASRAVAARLNTIFAGIDWAPPGRRS